MRGATVLAITMACGGALAATAAAEPLAWSPAAPLPGSPPKGTARGGEPSLSFDPTGNGWVYITTPDRRAGSAPGVHLWRSSDHGMTWSDPKDVGSGGGGSDSDVLALDDHTLVVGDLEVAATAICRSKDFGKTFGDGCDQGATYDQVGPVSDREWLTTRPGHPEIVYDTYDGLGQGFTPQTQVSHDGGSTWQPCGELLEPGSEAAAHYTVTGATENSEVIGRPAVAKDGTIYVPFTLPNQQAEVANSDPTESSMFIAISPPGGCDATSVWHDVTVWSKPGSNFVSLFPNVVVDAAQNVYVSGAGKLAGSDKQQGDYLWASPDKGKTFLPPVRINTPDIGAVQLQALAPGLGAGELLAGFYGSTNAKDANDLKSEWRYYVAQSFDGGRTWEQTTTTPDISHHGNICNKGIICTDTDNRNLLDFTTVAVDPATGCGYATFAVDPFNPLGATTLTHPAAAVSHQTSGACLVPGGGQSPTAGSGTGSLPPNVTPCTDRIGPSIRFRKGVQPHDRRFRIALYSRDRGCLSGGVGKVRRVRVAVARLTPKGCEFLRKGRLGKPGSCTKYVWLEAKHSGATWSYRSPRVRRGHYRLYEQAIDAAGNRGRIRHTRPFAVR